MNRAMRRSEAKHEERLVVKAIHVVFEDGEIVTLDISKVMIVDRLTKKDLFKAVMEKKA